MINIVNIERGDNIENANEINQQTIKYIKYLNKLTILNSLQRQGLISKNELINIKRHIQNKYKIQDYN